MEGHEHRLNVLREDLQSAKDKRIAELEEDRFDWRKGVDFIRTCLGDDDPNLSCVRLGEIVLTMRAKIERLEAEVARLKTCCTIEAMEGNLNVDSFVRDKESQIEKLEAELAKAKEQTHHEIRIASGAYVRWRKEVDKLEAELAAASEAFAEKDIERHNRIKELEGELEAANKHVEILGSQRGEAGKRIAELEADIQVYRGALGYAVPSGFGEKLTDGTIPRCGMCDANSKRASELEAELAKMKLELQ